MEPLTEATRLLANANVDVAAFALLLTFVVPFTVLTWRARRGAPFALRPIRAYTRLKQLVSQAAESGQPVHTGMGSGLIGGESTPDALMGLTAFDYTARYASGANQPVLGTAGDATILASAQGSLRQARTEAGFPELFQGRQMNFFGPDPFAYAAGVRDALRQSPHQSSVVIGQFGSEGLWIVESTQQQDLPQIGGASSPASAALLFLSQDDTAIGEELYGAGAYLHRPSHSGSLAAQDVLRAVIVVAIIVGVVLASVGVWR